MKMEEEEEYRAYVGEQRRRVDMVSGNGTSRNRRIYTSSSWSSSDPPPPADEEHSSSSARSSKPFQGFRDAGMDRKRRIARYKAYSMESRVKASIKSGFRWFKTKCSEFIHGY